MDKAEQWENTDQSAYVSLWRFDPPKKGASTDINIDAHRGDLEDLVVNKYQSSIEKGLTSEKHATILARDGPNRLTPPKGTPEIIKFLKQLFGGFALLLWAGALLCIIAFIISLAQQNIDLNYLYLAVVLSGVVTITAIFSYSQEAKSAKVMEGFKALTEQEALVRRDGQEFQTVPASNLVVGDIVSIIGGNKVPADIRIISASSFKVDNSSLTGESDPQSRIPEMTDTNPLETKNLAFFSTSATEGKCIGVVVATGDDTVIGKIAKLASSTSNVQTPINREIHHFIKIISAIAIILGVVFFIFGLVAGYDIVTDFVFAIGIIVANVPEGLLATVTVSLTLTSQRMARKNVLVKNLESVETLGSTTTICSDKTGTLTQNRMTVAHLWYNGEIYDAGANPELFEPDYDKNSVTFSQLLQCASLCNNAVFTEKEKELAEGVPIRQLKTNGDASETALLKFAEPVLNSMPSIGSVANYREQMPTSSDRAIPFNSSNKYQVSVHATGKSDQPWILVMKGAPERVLDRCSFVNVEGDIQPLTDEWKNNYLDSIRQLGENGERVLGFCNFPLDPEKFPADFVFDREEIGTKFPELEGFHLLGLISMIDPPRPAVPGAVKTCKSAGIKVVMVTGDYYVTAKAIAKQVNIITMPTVEDVAVELGIPVESVDDRTVDAIVVSGGQLANMTDYELDRVLDKKQIVFARTSPQQKLRIVAGCQRKKQIVAVTGDGVNDSPALKKADIGIAMGITGSDVSQEAADMILLDDNFASIVRGVKEGRLIFDNLKKSIAYTLSSNIPEIAPFILFIVLQLPLPLSTVLILAVDLGTDIIPAISLAYEGPESDIMRRKPRDAEVDNLVTTKLISFSYLQIGMIQALAGMYTYFVVMGDYGFPASWLIFSANDWDSDDEIAVDGNPPRDREYREDVLRHAQTAYFVSIVVVQWADLIICKTRRLSLFQQGMTNWALNFGLCSETVLAIIICYTPGIQVGLGTEPLRFVHWLPALPFSLLIFCYDETRKFYMRRGGRLSFISGWIERNTYY